MTKDSIKVVIRKPPDDLTNKGRNPIKDRATGQLVTVEDAVRDTVPMFEKTYQQWGRKLDIQVVESTSGRQLDRTAAAATVVSTLAMKPFAVVDVTSHAGGSGTEYGTEVFLSAIAKQKILALGGGAPNKIAIAQSPYRWPLGVDYSANALLARSAIPAAKAIAIVRA